MALAGILAVAASFLLAIKKMFLGKVWLKEPASWLPLLTDLTMMEKTILMVLVLATLILGLYPNSLLNAMNESVKNWLLLFPNMAR
jgi:NADH:ubiquinone oxidoreductase subunit 4 (subunit M)